MGHDCRGLDGTDSLLQNQMTMDSGYIKAFIICGSFTCIGTIVRPGPRRFFAEKHPFQADIGVFLLGGVGGALLYPLLGRLGGQ